MSNVSSELSSMTISGSQDSSVTAASGDAAARIVMMARPNHGTVGDPLNVVVNYYQMAVRAKIDVHRYEINIVHPIRQERLDRDECREKFWEVVRKNPEMFGNVNNLIYDDAGCLYTKEKLKLKEANVELQITRETPTGSRLAFLMRIQYTNVATIDLTMDMESMRSVSATFLDSLVTQNVRCPLVPDVSERYYPFSSVVYLVPDRRRNTDWSVPVGPGIEAWRGLHGAVKIGEHGDALFNADVSTSCFAKIRLSLIEYYLEVLNEFRGRNRDFTEQDLQGSREIAMDERSRKRLATALKGVRLMLTYGQPTSRTVEFKFLEILKPANIVRFNFVDPQRPNDPPRPITVEEYFLKHKNIKLRFPNLPVLHVGPRSRNIFIPMELLMVSARPQKFKKMLSDFQKSQMIRKASMTPGNRRRIIEDLVNALGYRGNAFMQEYGVKIGAQMLKLVTRVLPPPVLALREDGAGNPYKLAVQNGKWKLCNQFATNPPQRILFGAVCVDNSITDNDFWDSYPVLFKACELFGMKFVRQNPLFGEWRTRNESAHDQLTELVRHMQREAERVDPKCLLHILFMMDKRDAALYGMLKLVCDLEEGVSCQAILEKTFRSMRRSNPETNSTAHNLALKMNAKLGGINNKVHRNYAVWAKFTDKAEPTMFVGVDVTHPAPGRTGASIASVVTSVDLEATRYEVSIKVQPPGSERVVRLGDVMRERLVSYFESTGERPKHLVVYRDGISESEFSSTLREEISSLISTCQALHAQYKPTITYIIVQKRHHTRFFLESRDDRQNVPPGMVVDRVISDPQLFDFFLCSHFGAIGTSRSSHYYVLYDTWGLSADELQQATYALCHVYARCNKSVSLPAPVYYAHLACARANTLDTAIFGGSHRTSASAEGQRDRPVVVTEHQEALTMKNTTPQMYFV